MNNPSNLLSANTVSAPAAAPAFAPDHAARILESITDAFFALDADWRFTYVNAQAERLFRRPRAELLGRIVWKEFLPEEADYERECRRAVAEQSAASFEDYFPAFDAWFEISACPSAEGLSVCLRDITGRKRSEEALRRSAEGSRLLVEGAKDYAMILMDTAGQVTGWNTGAERIMGWTEAEAQGRPADLIFTPEDRAADVPAQEMKRAAAEGRALDLRWHLKKDGSRFFADGVMEPLRDEAGRLCGFAKVLRDATPQEEGRQRERFLASLAERARRLTDPDAVIADAVRSVGEFLGADRVIFGDIDVEADTCTTDFDYCADASVSSGKGVFSVSAFGAAVAADFAAGHPVVMNDVRLEIGRLTPGGIAVYESVGIRANITVPSVHSDRLVSVLGVHSRTPRRWKPEEVELLRSVVERTWLTVEVLRQHRTLAREAEDRREAHERTARILESITDAFYALDHEWRFTYVNAQAERLLQRSRADLLGRNIWEEFPEAVGGPFYRQYRRVMAKGFSLSVEDFYPPFAMWLEVRAFPSEDGLSVFFQNISARKALEAERERMAERERNIARQLQAALTPAVPEHIPGMTLAKYYEPALEEAGVGGDFYDVFPMDKGCTALVVGDFSGKGLAAATQVATVRNMLRYALYRARTLAAGLDGLNALLAEQGLLSGFCTLFVGAYDSAAGTLTYVNCGQEPALIRRAAGGRVEQLPPTGPVLGPFAGASFEERTVALRPGDAVAMFTDGLTEVGRSRREMLAVEGVAALLAQSSIKKEADGAETEAERLALSLIAGVDAAAQDGVTRDDMCLLVGVVE